LTVSRVRRDNYELWHEFVDTYKLVRTAVDRNLESIGMRVTEIRMLKMLSRAGPTPMTALAEEQLTTQASMTAQVDDLERKGMVERTRSKEDRRVVNVAITRKGEDALEEGLRRHKDFVDRVFGGLSEKEAAEFSLAMRRLRERLAV
jgi:MarR family transcriptional regulator, 2-MHQ and catechol-resistance regulon repressor